MKKLLLLVPLLFLFTACECGDTCQEKRENNLMPVTACIEAGGVPIMYKNQSSIMDECVFPPAEINI